MGSGTVELEEVKETQPARLKRVLPQILLAALLAGGVLTLITYPGIWYSDSYQRAKTAVQLLSQPDHSSMGSYLSLLPELVIGLCLEFTGSYAFYTWMQAAFFEAAGLVCIFWFFSGKAAWLLSALFVGCPLFLGYAVYWETGTVTAACLLLLVVATDAAWQQLRAGGQILRLAGVGLCSFLATGYRPNAATAIAGFAVWEAAALWRCKAQRRWRAAGIGVLLLGVLLAFRVPQMAGMQPVSNGVVGPMWETACMLHHIGEGNGYDTYLDDLIGAGNTKKIFAETEEPEASMYLFSDTLDYWSVPWSKNSSDQFLSKYVTLIREQPGAFFHVKGEMARRTLGELPFKEYEYDRDGGMAEYHFSDTPQRHLFFDCVTGFAGAWRWGRTPWKVLGTALVLLGIAFFLRRPAASAAKLLFIAVCYEGAFLLTTQSHEFRYWFPALLLLLVSMALSLAEILPAVRDVLRRRIRRKVRA